LELEYLATFQKKEQGVCKHIARQVEREKIKGTGNFPHRFYGVSSWIESVIGCLELKRFLKDLAAV